MKQVSAPFPAQQVLPPEVNTGLIRRDAGVGVETGQRVAAGDVLCIIESMKMMNEITADRAGVCVAVVARDGEAISSGQVLLRFES